MMIHYTELLTTSYLLHVSEVLPIRRDIEEDRGKQSEKRTREKRGIEADRNVR